MNTKLIISGDYKVCETVGDGYCLDFGDGLHVLVETAEDIDQFNYVVESKAAGA